jgi:hypothetical protein
MSRTRRFLVPFFLLALFSLAAHGAPQKEVRKTLPLAANGRVEVDTYKGSVDVTAEDRADVVVEARVVADTDCGDEKTWAEWVEATNVRIDAHPDLVLIESGYGRLEEYRQGFLSWCTSRPFVHYRIRMPRTASLDIKDYKSTIDVASLAGRVRLESYKGTMRVTGLDGRLDLETYKGTARVEFARLAGDVRVETYKGEIELSLPKGAAFTLKADADRHGRIRSDFGVPSQQAASRRSGDALRGAVNGGGPRLDATTHKGTIRITER